MLKISLWILLAGLFHPLQGINQGSGYIPGEDSVRIVEKVYLHIDREIYSPGDDLWFKGYLIDAASRVLTGHSNNLHVELISPDSKIIDSRIIRINEGLGNGDFQLSKTLSSGKYLLRVYTNYMRNIGDQQFFTKEISVINPSDAEKISADSTREYIGNKPEISFFPEGGSLVENVPSIVGFKAVNALGKSCEITGKLYTASGELISEFKSTHKGMGSFAFKPVPGVDYYVIFKCQDGDEVKREIPASFASGVVLNVSGNKTGEIDVTIRTNQKTLPLLTDHDLSLTVSSHNISYTTTTFRIKSLSNSLVLRTENIPDGIVMLTLSETGKKPLCERLVFIQNNDDIKINLETDKTVYKQRDSVSVRISMTDNYAIAPEAYISLSAAEEVSAQAFTQFPSTISSWFLLESDIHGPVEAPSFYFDQTNPERLKQLDLLLLTQGWRDFQWKYKDIYYPAEHGFSVSGRVRNKFADKPIIDSRVFIGIFKNGNPVIKTVPTDSSGKFHLNDLDLAGNATIMATAVGENERLHGWLLLDSLKYMPPEVGDTSDQSGKGQSNIKRPTYKLSAEQDQSLNEYITGYIQYSEIKNSIQRKYKLSDTILPGEVKIVAKRSDMQDSPVSRSRRYLMGIPDKSLKITPEMEKYGTLKQLIWSNLNFTRDMERVIFLIDGVKVSAEMFFSVPPSFIESFDVLNTNASIAVFGANTEDPLDQTKPADGVLSITTRKDGPRISSKLLYHSASIRFSGYDEPRIFYSPKHHSNLEYDYKPDLRTTLLWEPDLRLQNNRDLNLKYYNSDNSSTVKIIAEGITSTGIPVTGSVKYTVH